MFKTHIFLFLLSFVFFILTFAGLTVFNIFQASNTSYSHFSDLTKIKQKQQLVATKKITGTFTAQQNHLGIITVPFIWSKNDKIIFRIKEKEDKNWYAQNLYNTNQLQPNTSITFGFPQITNARSKSYTFEIESLRGNKLSLFKNNSFFVAEYIFSKSTLEKNPSELLGLIRFHLGEGISRFNFMQIIFLCISILIPFVIYFAVKSFPLNFFIKTFSKNNILKILCNSLLTIMVINLLLISFAELMYPYSREYRDGALIDIAHQFAIGKNPFTITNSLPHTYTYGFLPPFITAVVSRLFHFDLVFAHHAVIFLCIVLLCFIVSKEIFQKTKSKTLVLMTLIIVLLYNGVSLRADSFAILLTIYSLFFIQNNKVLNFKKIILLSSIIIALFYTKQYFILLLPVIATYFVFNQPKKYLVYLLCTTLLLGFVSLLIVNRIFPLYFVETIINYVNVTGGPSTWTGHSPDYVIKQSIVFMQSNWLLCFIFVISVIIGFLKNMVITFNITDNTKPLFILPDTPLKNIYFTYTFIALLFLTFLLGYHGGSYLSYYFQLLPIPLCMFSILFSYDVLKKQKYKETVFSIIALVFISEYHTFLIVPAIDFTKQQIIWNIEEFRMNRVDPITYGKQQENWDNVINYITKHDPQNTYISPTISIEAIKRDWPFYDNGQTEYYIDNLLTPSSQQFGFITPQEQQKKIAAYMKNWQNELEQKVINKKFSLIVLSEGYHAILNDTNLVKYYAIKDKKYVPIIPVSLGTLEFWEPK